MSFINGYRIVTDGLILHYDFSDSNSYVSGSSTVVDLTGNGYNGTITGTYSYSTKYNGSIRLNTSASSNGGITISNFQAVSNVLGGSFNFTFFGAIEREYYGIGSGTSGMSYIFRGAGNGFSTGYRIVLGGGTPGAAVTDSPIFLSYTNSNTGVSPEGLDNPNASNKMIFGISRISTTGSSFVNGVIYTGSLSDNYVSSLATGPVIGYTSFGVGSFNGLMPFFLVYNRGLSNSELNQNYNALRYRMNL
jgi:hypothetical protein